MLKVEVRNGKIENALKELKGKFIKTKVTQNCKEREEYVKKSVRKRQEKIKAVYKQKKEDNK